MDYKFRNQIAISVTEKLQRLFRETRLPAFVQQFFGHKYVIFAQIRSFTVVKQYLIARSWL